MNRRKYKKVKVAVASVDGVEVKAGDVNVVKSALEVFQRDGLKYVSVRECMA